MLKSTFAPDTKAIDCMWLLLFTNVIALVKVSTLATANVKEPSILGKMSASDVNWSIVIAIG